MSDRNLPAVSPPFPPPAQHGDGFAFHSRSRPAPADDEESGIPWGRYLHALRRGKWFLLGAAVLGAALGVFASRRIVPEYETHATIWVSTSSEGRQQSGPIRAAELLQSSSWVELLRSFAIADSVVDKLRLYVSPRLPADTVLFSSFDRAERIRPGHYFLNVDSAGGGYRIVDGKKRLLERGVVGDSIGRGLGFRWQPSAGQLRPGRSVEFFVQPPRETAIGLLGNLTSVLPEDGQFLRLIMTGRDPRITAMTLNTWAEQFVASATELKKHNLIEFRKILESQLDVAERELHVAEMDLERFRVQTITLPSESGPVAGGIEATRAPVLQNYFERKTEFENIRHDREALESLLRAAGDRPVAPDALYSVPGIIAANPPLRAALDELSERKAELRTVQRTFTEAHPRVQQLTLAVATLENETIPHLTTGVLESLRRAERNLDGRITGASRELREIPTRTIEEMRLRRQVSVSETLYNTLKSRYEEAKLAEAGTTPDVSVLDVAVPPQRPRSSDGPRVIFLAIVAFVGLAVGLVLLLDRLDRRFRYPEQATKALGLAIVGAVPRLRSRSRRPLDVETMASLVEAFRTLRLSIRHEWAPGTPITLTVSSPGPSEGKSLVASNLAVSFANAGQRVVLVDGDARRGALNRTFGVARGPGLIDYLDGSHPIDEIIQSANMPNLSFIGSGSRPVNAPELLASERLLTLMSLLRERYDVVIVDAPPLLAGSDPLALGVATGNLLMVLRTAVSDWRLADAKLELVDRLPIRVLGTVLNGIEEKGMYRYYGYEYAAKDGVRGSIAALAAPMGGVRA